MTQNKQKARDEARKPLPRKRKAENEMIAAHGQNQTPFAQDGPVFTLNLSQPSADTTTKNHTLSQLSGSFGLFPSDAKQTRSKPIASATQAQNRRAAHTESNQAITEPKHSPSQPKRKKSQDRDSHRV
ncbi:hypothetical protein SLS57_012496 [Botryosphaeria dothidea]